MSRVAAIQMTSGPVVADNLQRAGELIAQAAEQGAELVLLPECFAAFGNRSLQAIADAEWGSERPIRRFLAAQARAHGRRPQSDSPHPADPTRARRGEQASSASAASAAAARQC